MSFELLNVRIDDYSFNQAIDKGCELINTSNKVSQVVTINPEMFNEIEKNPEFAKLVSESEMVIPDGVGIKIALALKGQNAMRIPGVDFAKKLLEKCAESSVPIAIIGSKEEVITKAIQNLRKELSGLNIVYYHNGYFDNDEQILNELKEANAKLILVALGSPKQEFFIYNAKKVLPPALMVGIGGSLDVWSGAVKRAPIIFQRLGLEWFYRTVSQPERFKRIFPALPLFLIKVLLHKKG